MALTDLTRISTSGIATGSTIDAAILRKDVSFRGSQVGVQTALFDASDDELKFQPNAKLSFSGTSLQIYHGSNVSHIAENGTGPLRLSTDEFQVMNSAQNKTMIHAAQNLAVSLNYNGNTKIETTNHGAVVTGILTASSFSGPIGNPSGISTFYDLRVTNNLTVEGTTSTLDTDLIGVDRVEVGANSNSVVGVAITQSGTADIVNLFDGTTEVLTVKDGGSVGIGTINPAAPLHILSDANNMVQIQSTDRHSTLYLIDSIGSSFIQNDSGELRFGVGGGASASGGETQALRIDNNGNVGIGSHTTPDTLLHLQGDTPKLRIESTNKLEASAGTEEIGRIEFEASKGSNINVAASLRVRQDGTWSTVDDWFSPTAIEFYTQDQSGTEITEPRLIINRDGKIGIGTNSVDANLTVHTTTPGENVFNVHSDFTNNKNRTLNLYAPATDSGYDPYIFQTGNSLQFKVDSHEGLKIQDNGRVGIGTTNPNAQLDVYKTGTATVVDTIITRTSGGGAFAVQCSDVAAANPVWALRTYSSEDLVLSPGGHANANEKVRIKANTGYVGIGTDNPKAQLEVYKVGTGVTATSVVRGEHAVFAIMGDKTNTGASETDARLVFSSDGDVNPSKILTSPLVNHGFEIALINEEPGSGLRFHDGTAETERLRITSSGKVLIGDGLSYSPSGMLHIIGDDNSNGPELYLMVANNNTTDNIGALVFGNNVDKSVCMIRSSTHTANNTGDIEFHTSTTGTMTERLRIKNTGTIISTITSPDPYNTVNENMTIVNGAGNQGAGSKIRFATGNANAEIESRVTGGNSNSGTSLNFAVSDGASNAEECLRITPSGNILQRARPYSNTYQNTGWGMARYVKSGWLMAQSSFNNPTMDLVDLPDQGNAYHNLFFKVTAMQIRFRGSNNPEGQIHIGYASAKRDPSGTNTWYAYVGTMVQENAASGFSSGSNVGTLSWSQSNNFDSATLRYTGNREDNYDTYQVCVEVWSNNNDSLAHKLSSGMLA